MKCEKCGKDITHITTSRFSRDGSDYDDTIGIEEDEHYNAVIMETDRNWTGYELSEEEMRERIECPYCKHFPYGIEWCVECHSRKCWIVPETGLCSSKEEATEKWNTRTPKERGGEK